MITYRPYQKAGAEKALAKFQSGIRSVCLCSPCGSGKTATGALAALQAQRVVAGPILWIAHRKELIRQAAKHLEEIGHEVGIIAPWAKPKDRQIQVASVQTLRARNQLPHASMLVWDECFVGGTLISSPMGPVPVQEVRPGSWVLAWNGREIVARQVLSVSKREAPLSLVRVRAGDASFVCTKEHPVYTEESSYTSAGLIQGRTVVVHGEPRSELLRVREKNGGCGEAQKVYVAQDRRGLLLHCVSGRLMEQKAQCHDVANEWQICVRKDEKEEPYAARGGSPEGVAKAYCDGPSTYDSGWEWSPCFSSAIDACATAGRGLDLRDGGQNREEDAWDPDALQDRHRQPSKDDCGGSGRDFPLLPDQAVARCEEGRLVERKRVDSVEVLERGGDAGSEKVFGDGFVYNIEVDGCHNYFANGVLVHNCHHILAPDYVVINRHYNQQGRCLQLGLTATPERSDGAGLGYAYRSLIIVAQPSALIRAGYLVPTDALTPPPKIRKGLATDPYRAWKEHAYGKQTIIFCANVEHGLQVTETFRANGVAAAFLDAESPSKERTRVLDRFHRRRVTVLVNVALFAEGVDVPGIECTMIARRVGSFGMYLQMAGRGSRPSPGKTLATLLDMTGAYHTFGLPDDDHVFSLRGTKPIKLRKQAAKLYPCPRCGCIQKSMAKRCPRCSGHVGVESRIPPSLRERLSRVSRKTSPEQRKQTFIRWRDYTRYANLPIEWALTRYKARFGEAPDPSW